MQQPRRFQAATLRDAYAQVREALGADAVILSTRSSSTPGVMGLGRRPSVEVVASLPDTADPATAQLPLETGLAMHDLVRGVAEADAQALDLGLTQPAPNTRPSARIDTIVSDTNEPTPVIGEHAEIEEHAPAGPLGLYARMQALGAPPASMPPRIPETWLTPVPGADSDESTTPSPPMQAHASEPPVAPLPSSMPLPEPGEAARITAALADLRSDVAAMRYELSRLTSERLDAMLGDAPPALIELRQRLETLGVREGLLLDVMQRVLGGLRRGASPEAIRRSVERHLAAALPPAPVLDLTTDRGVVLLAGPGGAGKTTFALQLAGDLVRRHGRRVVVASTAIDRAGAPQQFMAAALAAGVAGELCYDSDDLAALVEDRSTDLVIVDTPGGAGHLAELASYAAVASHRVLLTIPATMQTAGLDAALAAYACLDPAGVVLTRCDEAVALGSAYSALATGGAGLAFTSHGESLRLAPRPGDHSALAAALTRGRWPEPPRNRRAIGQAAPVAARAAGA